MGGIQILKVQSDWFNLRTGLPGLVQEMQYHAGNTPVGLQDSGVLSYLKLPDIGQ